MLPFRLSAAQQSVGKTTLAKRIHHILTGRDLPVLTWAGEKNETETEKTLLAVLLGSPAMLVFDNLGNAMTFKSAAISGNMTSPSFSGRFLGLSRMVTVPTNTVYVLTGNNIS